MPSPGASAVARDAPIDLLFNVPLAAEALGIGDVALVSGTTTIPSELTVDLLERRLRLSPLQALRPTLRHNVIIKDLLGLDGSRLSQTISFEFTTGQQRQGSPAAVTSVSATEVQPIWDRHCTRCHAGQHPRAGLDLSSVQASLGALVEVPSSESPLRRVTSGDHATSYLMRKLLGRLAIVGLPMPPDAPRLPPDQLRLVADWIDTGALP